MATHRQSVEHTRAEAAWNWMYSQRKARKRVMGGQPNRSVTERNGRVYHVTKGYRGLIKPRAVGTPKVEMKEAV